MTRCLSLIAFLLLVAFPTPQAVQAQNDGRTGAAAATRIGFVDTLEVLYETEEGRLGIDRVEQFMRQKQQEFEQQTQELQEMRDRFATQQRTLNPETRAELQRSMEEREVRLKRFQEDTQLEISRRRDRLLGEMSEKIQRLIDEYAREHDFGAIFLRDQSQFYVAPGLDLTEEIVQLYNERNSSGAGSAAPGGSR